VISRFSYPTAISPITHKSHQQITVKLDDLLDEIDESNLHLLGTVFNAQNHEIFRVIKMNMGISNSNLIRHSFPVENIGQT